MKRLLNSLKNKTLLVAGLSVLATSSVMAVNLGDTGITLSGSARWFLGVNTPQISNGGKQNLSTSWGAYVRPTLSGKHTVEALGSKFVWNVSQQFLTNSSTPSVTRFVYVGLENEKYGTLLLGQVGTFMEGLITDGMVDGGLFGDNGGYVYRYPAAIKYTAPSNLLAVEGLSVGALLGFNPNNATDTARYPLGYDVNVGYANEQTGLDLGVGYAAAHNQGNYSTTAGTMFNSKPTPAPEKITETSKKEGKFLTTTTTTTFVGGFNSQTAVKLGWNKDGVRAGLRYAYKYYKSTTKETKVVTEDYKDLSAAKDQKEESNTVAPVLKAGTMKMHVYGVYAGFTTGDHDFGVSFEYNPNVISNGVLTVTKTGVVAVEYNYNISKELVWATSVAQKFEGMRANEIDNTNPGTKHLTTIGTNLTYNF